MPDQRRPGVVEHPLNHAGRSVLVPAIGLEHRALAVVGHRLRLALVVVERSRWTITARQSVGKYVHRGKAFFAGVIIPHVIDGPEMFLRDEFLERLARWYRRPRTRLRVVAIRTAGLSVGEPVDRRDVLVGARHFYAGIASQLCWCIAGGR